MKRLFTLSSAFVLLVLLLVAPGGAFARENVTDWYIRDFDSQIIVNKDSSLSIIETIVADCGMAVGKHGIFRILPTRLSIDGKKVETPVTLGSITDENGTPYAYQTIENTSDGTVTWKIGDADKTVRGVHTYIISYTVQNAIRFGNAEFDELYWNLNGNFWDLETDAFHAVIRFPKEVTDSNTAVDYYVGLAGSKDKTGATYVWTAPSVLEFRSTSMLPIREGITASVTFPKGIFTPYVPGFFRTYGRYLALLFPLSAFLFGFSVWYRYGKDSRIRKAIMAEYEVPEGLPPLLMGMFLKKGAFRDTFVTAEIVFFATRGVITIREVGSRGVFPESDYEFVRLGNSKTEALFRPSEQKLLREMFSESDTIRLSSLGTSLRFRLPALAETAKQELRTEGLIGTGGELIQTLLFVAGFFSAVGAVTLAFAVGSWWGWSGAIASVILFGFSFLMSKWTDRGAELVWRIRGFRLFLETVDRDRARFYERENLFEAGLPYAILFGMTGEWIRRIREIYGEEYISKHASSWYVGGEAAFDIDMFTGSMERISSAMASNSGTSSVSGSGGSGSSGGGGGGGGGGGW